MKHLLYSLNIFLFCTNLSAFWHQPKYEFYAEKPDIFPIGLLPRELQNTIASYLLIRKSFEAEEEFKNRLLTTSEHTSIARGRWSYSKLGQLQQCSLCPTLITENRVWMKAPTKDWNRYTKNKKYWEIIFALAFDASALVAFIETGAHEHCKKNYKYLYIYNFRTKQRIIKKINKPLDYEKLDDIAITSNATKVAFTAHDPVGCHIYQFVLETGNIFRIETRKVLKNLNFTKQGTLLGIKIPGHKSLLVPVINPSKENLEVVENPFDQKIEFATNQLGQYFRQSGVCKNWPQKNNIKKEQV